MFPLLKGGGGGEMEHNKFYPVLKGRGAKCFGPAIFPFCSPPLPLANVQSLKGLKEDNIICQENV